MPFYLANVKLLSSDVSGVIMLTHPAVMMCVAWFSGRASDRWGHKRLTTAGLTVTTLTSAFLGLLGISTPLIWAFLCLFGVGLGSGLYTSPSNNAIMSSVPPDQTGIASGMIATTRTIGQTLGVSLGSSMVSSRTLYYASALSDPAGIYALAQRDAYWACAAIVALMTLATVWTYRPRVKYRGTV
jgi:MFS family permease